MISMFGRLIEHIKTLGSTGKARTAYAEEPVRIPVRVKDERPRRL